jgi:spermidine synthase
MNKWELLETTLVPDSQTQMSLYKNGDDYSICVDGKELMNTRKHGSEESLADLGCKKLMGRPDGRVLVGGLGMGFTLAATLRHVGPKAKVEVAELVPAVQDWNRDYLGEFAGFPLKDARVKVDLGDVADVLRNNPNGFDSILLDVDNGPSPFTQDKNTWLYWPEGLGVLYKSLRPQGVVAIWSAYSDRKFFKRLVQAGFMVKEHQVGVHANGSGGRHFIWVADKVKS